MYLNKKKILPYFTFILIYKSISSSVVLMTITVI